MTSKFREWLFGATPEPKSVPFFESDEWIEKPLTDAEYEGFYRVYVQGIGNGDPDRKPCGCWAKTDHCGACKAERRCFERERKRRASLPKPRPGDWIDTLAGKP